MIRGRGASCLPLAAPFSPSLRVVAWSDTSSIRRKLMYGGSASVIDTPSHSHEINSSKSLRVRPQTIPYRPKSGELSARPYSAPPGTLFNQKENKKSSSNAGTNCSLSTVNLTLPQDHPAAKSSCCFQPKIPPKKQCGVWCTELNRLRRTVPLAHPRIVLQLEAGSSQRSYRDINMRRKIRRRGPVKAGPQPDLHLSHRVAHLNRQLLQAGDAPSQGGFIAVT